MLKKSRYTAEQITFALSQAEEGTPVLKVCRKMGIAEQTFYRWRKRFLGMGVAEVRRLRAMSDLCSAVNLAVRAASGFFAMPPLFEDCALKSALFI